MLGIVSGTLLAHLRNKGDMYFAEIFIALIIVGDPHQVKKRDPLEDIGIILENRHIVFLHTGNLTGAAAGTLIQIYRHAP
jgi:hypothetical protein